MTDDTQNTPPIEVSTGTAKEQVGAAVRDAALVAAAVPTLVALVGKHDVVGLANWLSSVGGAPALGLAVTGAVFVSRQIKTRLDKHKLIVAALAAPDTAAKVVARVG